MNFIRLYMRNPAAVIGLILLFGVLFMAASADLFFPGNPLRLAGPPMIWPFENPQFLLGTGPSGRSIMAQIFHGARTTLLVGVVATSIAITFGTIVGAVSGYYGRWIDDALMRGTEGFQIVPPFLLVLVLVAVFGASLLSVTLSIGLVSWPAPARLARAEFLSIRSREFVQSCRVIGVGDTKIMFREILPNAMPPLIVYASVIMAVAILMEAALAFLGLSDPNMASWGNLIGVGYHVLRTGWYVSAIAGVAILVTVLAVSLVGQGLNDAMNPRLKSL